MKTQAVWPRGNPAHHRLCSSLSYMAVPEVISPSPRDRLQSSSGGQTPPLIATRASRFPSPSRKLPCKLKFVGVHCLNSILAKENDLSVSLECIHVFQLLTFPHSLCLLICFYLFCLGFGLVFETGSFYIALVILELL